MMMLNLTQYDKRLNKLSGRERVLVAIGLVVMMVILWELIIFSPLNHARQKTIAQRQATKQQIKQLQTQTSKILEVANQLKNTALGRQHTELVHLIKKIDRQLHLFTQQDFTIGQIIGLLKTLIDESGEVTLIKLETVDVSTEQIEQPAKAESATSEQETSVDKVLKQFSTQTMSMVLQGEFFAIQRYLNAVEREHVTLFWDSMDYQVQSYPKAQVKLLFHTMYLSDEQT